MRVGGTSWLRAIVLSILCLSLPHPASLAGDGVPPSAGQVRLANGRLVDYTIYFDRNSLTDSVRVGKHLIALTSSGTLLRFDLPAVRFARERVGNEEVTCLGTGENGEALAGLADGRLCRIDSVSLELTEVAKLPSAPRWIGWSQSVARKRAGGLVVVTRATRPVDHGGKHWDVPFFEVHDRPHFSPSTFFIPFLQDARSPVAVQS